jgi:hypothetical protein
VVTNLRLDPDLAARPLEYIEHPLVVFWGDADTLITDGWVPVTFNTACRNCDPGRAVG